MKKILLFFLIISQNIFSQNESTTRLDLGKAVYIDVAVCVFESKFYDVKYVAFGGQSVVSTIDGKLVVGTDGNLPFTRLNSIVLYTSGDSISLDVSSMYNPFGKSLIASKMNFKFIEIPNGGILQGEFSDGAGYYIAEWLIQYGESLRTKLLQF